MEFQRTTSHVRAISFTPLIDVVFLLVIFFMLTTGYSKTESLELALPSEGAPQVISGTAPMVVVVTDDGRVFLGKEQVPAAHLSERLAPELKEDPGKKIMLISTNNATLQQMVSVMDRIYDAGGHNIAISYWKY